MQVVVKFWDCLQIVMKVSEVGNMHAQSHALQRMAHYDFIERIKPSFHTMLRRILDQSQLDALVELIDSDPYFRRVSKLAQHQRVTEKRACAVRSRL